jgi:hypothetical protein
MGFKKAQPQSEFVYKFVCRGTSFTLLCDTIESILKKRKNESQEDTTQESSLDMKRQKTEVPVIPPEILEELKQKEEALLQQAKRLQELEEMVKKNKDIERELEEERKAKEAMLSNQQASFHEQLSKLQLELEDHKKKASEEQSKILEQTERQVHIAYSLLTFL